VNRCSTAAVLSLAFLLPACSQGDGRAVAPASGPTSSAPSPSSGSPSGAPRASVAPATGPLLRERNASLHAPLGYRRMPDLVDYVSTAGDPGSTDLVNLSDSTGYLGDDLDALAASVRRTKSFPRRLQRLPDAELDGVEAYRLAGPASARLWVEEYGAYRGGHAVAVEFELDRSLPGEERRTLIDSVLATFRWR
jgi:hypothetical protein